jgi:DNA-binding Lrp family transcriptional regulator
MEKRGIIVKYPAMINWNLAGGEEVEALIEVRVTPSGTRALTPSPSASTGLRRCPAST